MAKLIVIPVADDPHELRPFDIQKLLSEAVRASITEVLTRANDADRIIQVNFDRSRVVIFIVNA